VAAIPPPWPGGLAHLPTQSPPRWLGPWRPRRRPSDRPVVDRQLPGAEADAAEGARVRRFAIVCLRASGTGVFVSRFDCRLRSHGRRRVRRRTGALADGGQLRLRLRGAAAPERKAGSFDVRRGKESVRPRHRAGDDAPRLGREGRRTAHPRTPSQCLEQQRLQGLRREHPRLATHHRGQGRPVEGPAGRHVPPLTVPAVPPPTGPSSPASGGPAGTASPAPRAP